MTVSESPLILTKVRIPPLRELTITRARLLERLSHDEGRFVLVSAPAGYGKTTLLAGLSRDLQRTGVVAAWYSLDPSDDDPLRFSSYLLAAVAYAIGEQPQLELLIRLFRSSPQVDLLRVVAALINAVIESGRECVVVLDDYHAIGSPAIHSAIAFLINYLPPQMRLLIGSRSDPPLPLAILRARAQLIELRASDLRFDNTEIATFLTSSMGLEVTKQEIDLLAARTEGWATALQLAGVGLHGCSDRASYIARIGQQRFVLDYLAEEIFNRLALSLREFLLRTCVLDRLTASLCSALLQGGAEVASQATCQGILEQLEHENLFTVALDEEGKWYRYHALFADFLRARLHRTLPEIEPQVHRRAAQWFAHTPWLGDAVRHALAADDFELAAQIIEEAGDSLWVKGELNLLLNALKLLPGEMRSSHPRLCILHAWTLALSGRGSQLLAAEQELRSIEMQMDGNNALGTSEMQGMALAVHSTIASMRREDSQQALALARQALALLPEDNRRWRGVATFSGANAYYGAGEARLAQTAYQDAIQVNRLADNLYLVLRAQAYLALQLKWQGMLEEAAATCAKVLQNQTRLGVASQSSIAGCHLVMGSVNYQWNNLDVASDHLERALELGSIAQNSAILRESHMALADVNQAQGSLEGARSHLAEAERIGREQSASPGPLNEVRVAQARLWLRQGQEAEAIRWAAGLDLAAAYDWHAEQQYLMQARVMALQKKPKAAVQLVDSVIRAAEAAGRMERVMEALVVRTLVNQDISTEQVLASLIRAVELAAPEGYVRLFVDEGTLLRELLLHGMERKAWARPDLQEFLNRLLASFELQAHAPSGREMLIETLSERERQVLSLMAGGASNQDIADRLVITVGTVKTHINHILGKLQARNRTEAVARAKELGLLRI